MSRTPEQVIAEIDAMGYPRANNVRFTAPTANEADANEDWKPIGGKFAKSATAAAVEARRRWKASATPEQLTRIEQLLVEERELLDELASNQGGHRLEARLERELRAAGAGPRTLEHAKNPAPYPAWCAVRDWWEAVPRPTWLVLVGPRGRGKTVGATWAVRQAFELGKSARILHASALEGLSSYGDGRREFDDLTRTWLLVLSDYQVSPTDRAKTQLFRLLDLRHEHKRLTIITSNLARADLARRLEGPIASRIRSDGVIVELPDDGQDFRQTSLLSKTETK